MSPAMIVPAIPQLSQELNLTSENSKQLLVSIYVLSWCLGPLFWAPLSEAYGRLTLLNVGTTLFLVANLLCGVEWIGVRFLALRFVAGFVGSAANAVSFYSALVCTNSRRTISSRKMELRFASCLDLRLTPYLVDRRWAYERFVES